MSAAVPVVDRPSRPAAARLSPPAPVLPTADGPGPAAALELATEALTGSGMTSLRTRERLVQRLADAGIGDERVLAALRALPRHLFVDEALASRAYEDSALPIGHGQTISQPYTVARMTEVLLGGPCAPAPGRARGTAAAARAPAPPLGTVLEIGTGSGFQTAVLARLVRRVYSVERVAALWDRADQRLRALKLRNVRLRHGDGHLGWPEYAPFDGILITAAALAVPLPLIGQLAIGGRMVLPVERGGAQVLLCLTRTAAGLREQVLEPVTFVPLLGGIA